MVRMPTECRGAYEVSCSIMLCYIPLNQGLSLNLELANLVKVASQWTSKDYLSPWSPASIAHLFIFVLFFKIMKLRF